MKLKIILGLAIALQLVLLIGFKFTAWPEMLLWPYLITKGWLPYTDIAIAHTPLLIVKLAIFFKIFGTGILQLKIFTWIVIFVLDVLVYWIAGKLWNKKTAIFSLGSFIIFQLFYDGNGLWFDLFMGVFAFISYYFAKKKNWFWAGAFWGLAFISKQTAVWFLIPLILEILKSKKLVYKNIFRILAGSIATGVVFVLALLGTGIFKNFWYWAVGYGIFILPKASGQIQLPDFKALVISAFPYLIFVSLLLNKKYKRESLLTWAVAGILGAYPRFEYFHFQPGIPYLAIAAGIVLSGFRKIKGNMRIFIIIYLLGILYLFTGFFMRNWAEGTRFFEPDVKEVVSYVKLHTRPGDKIFVMNWWDNIYALTGTLPAADPWVPQLPWYQDLSGIQEKEVSDLQNNKPEMILLNPYSGIGLSSYIPEKVFGYVKSQYNYLEKVDGIEILVKK